MLATKTATAARTSQMPPSPPKDLLAEPNLTAQGQRRADWGIIKEMSLYLWPKVRPTCLPRPACPPLTLHRTVRGLSSVSLCPLGFSSAPR